MPLPLTPGVSHGCPMCRQELQAGSREKEKTGSTLLWGSRPSTPGRGPPPHLARSPRQGVRNRGVRGVQDLRLRRDGCCLRCRSLGVGRGSQVLPPPSPPIFSIF